MNDLPASRSAVELMALFERAVDVVVADQDASLALVQRRLRIRYSEAALLLEQMEVAGIVSAPNFEGRRKVLKARRVDRHDGATHAPPSTANGE